MFEFEKSTRKIGLKMMNRTHADERKIVQLCYLVLGCVISVFIFVYQLKYVSMVR